MGPGSNLPAGEVFAMAVGGVAKVGREIARLDRNRQLRQLRRLERRLRQDDPAERRRKLAESARLLCEWASRPPDHDDAWWDDFERELRENRLQFGAVQTNAGGKARHG